MQWERLVTGTQALRFGGMMNLRADTCELAESRRERPLPVDVGGDALAAPADADQNVDFRLRGVVDLLEDL